MQASTYELCTWEQDTIALLFLILRYYWRSEPPCTNRSCSCNWATPLRAALLKIAFVIRRAPPMTETNFVWVEKSTELRSEGKEQKMALRPSLGQPFGILSALPTVEEDALELLQPLTPFQGCLLVMFRTTAARWDAHMKEYLLSEFCQDSVSSMQPD